ncbi:MAG: dephospho-CoA kinase [Reichenbachiella sp.]
MIKVGITGGIGSGKSTICKIFSVLGIPIYDSDNRAKYLMNTSPVIREQITAEFGKEAYQEDQQLNRTFIAQQVFNDGNRIELLNSIIHPQVAIDFNNWTHSNPSAPYVIKEAALLVESGAYKALDHLINISCPEELRVQRIKQRDAFRSEDEIRAIIAKQLTDNQREKHSQFIIHNDEATLLIPQVLEIHKQLT